MAEPFSPEALTEPGRAMAVEGDVVQLGPDGVAVSMTPDAADETAEALVEAAAEAREQAPEAVDDQSEPSRDP